MEASRLGIPPPELRVMMWELAVTYDKTLLVAPKSCDDSTECKPAAANNKHITAVLSVCKQMRSECMALFYSLNTFEVRTGYLNWRDTFKIGANFFKSISHRNEQMITNMHWTIAVPDCPTRGLTEAGLRDVAMEWVREVSDDLVQIVDKIHRITKGRKMTSLRANIHLHSPSAKKAKKANRWYTFPLDFLNTKASFEHASILQRRRWPYSVNFPFHEISTRLGGNAVAQLAWAIFCHNEWQD
ncbi:hypothetical protein BST61_g3621 [Cercospora zeina]